MLIFCTFSVYWFRYLIVSLNGITLFIIVQQFKLIKALISYSVFKTIENTYTQKLFSRKWVPRDDQQNGIASQQQF